MALTATVAAGDADSYVTLADCYTYWDARGFNYSAYTETQIEQAIRRAAAWLDGTYRAKYPGFKQYGRQSVTPQALEWPRSDAIDVDGYAIPVGTVPQEVKDAQCEAARREVEVPGSLAPDVVPGQIKTLVAVEGIRWQAGGAGGANAQKPVLAVVDNILGSLIAVHTGRLLRS